MEPLAPLPENFHPAPVTTVHPVVSVHGMYENPHLQSEKKSIIFEGEFPPGHHRHHCGTFPNEHPHGVAEEQLICNQDLAVPLSAKGLFVTLGSDDTNLIQQVEEPVPYDGSKDFYVPNTPVTQEEVVFGTNEIRTTVVNTCGLSNLPYTLHDDDPFDTKYPGMTTPLPPVSTFSKPLKDEYGFSLGNKITLKEGQSAVPKQLPSVENVHESLQRAPPIQNLQSSSWRSVARPPYMRTILASNPTGPTPSRSPSARGGASGAVHPKLRAKEAAILPNSSCLHSSSPIVKIIRTNGPNESTFPDMPGTSGYRVVPPPYWPQTKALNCEVGTGTSETRHVSAASSHASNTPASKLDTDRALSSSEQKLLTSFASISTANSNSQENERRVSQQLPWRRKSDESHVLPEGDLDL